MNTERTLPIFAEEIFSMPTYAHGAVIVNLSVALVRHDPTHSLGRVFGPHTTYPMEGDPLTREPDVTWVRADRLPADLNVDPAGPPDLAVEVVSRTDTYSGTDARIKQYLASGVNLIWIIDPWLRTVTVYDASGPITIVDEHGTLTGGTVIPGFRVEVAELFT